MATCASTVGNLGLGKTPDWLSVLLSTIAVLKWVRRSLIGDLGLRTGAPHPTTGQRAARLFRRLACGIHYPHHPVHGEPSARVRFTACAQLSFCSESDAVIADLARAHTLWQILDRTRRAGSTFLNCTSSGASLMAVDSEIQPGPIKSCSSPCLTTNNCSPVSTGARLR